MAEYDDDSEYGQDDSGFRVALNQSSVAGLGRNPEMVAKMVRAARRLGVATSQIRHDNGADAEHRIKRQEFTSLADIAPNTARWVAKDPDHASLVQDDLDNASRMEGLFGYWSLAKQAVKKAVPVAAKGINETISNLTTLSGGQALARALGNNDPGKMWRENIDHYNRQIQGIEKVKPSSYGQELAKMTFDTLAANAVTLPLGLAGKVALLLGFAATAPGNLEEYQKAGYSPATAALYSTGNKAMEGLSELIGVSRLYKGGNTALRRGAEFVLGDLFGEEINKAYSFAVDKTTLKPEIGLKEFGQSALDTALVTALAGGAQGGMIHGVARLSDEYQQHRQAQLNKTFMLALGESAGESKLLKRLPEKYRELVQHAKEGGGVDNVYIPGDKWRQYWQEQRQQDPAQVAASMFEGGAEQYAEALATGGDLVIPLENYAEVLAASEHHAPLTEYIKLHPGDQTPEEAAAFVADQEAIGKEVQEAEGAAVKERPSYLSVYDDLMGQLTGIGYDTTTAQQMAVFGAARAKQRAAALGRDALELYHESPLHIVRPLQEGVRRRTVDTGLDPLLDRLRADDIPTEESIFGQSLLPFVRERGIKDDRGDLKSMDVDAVRQPGKRNILRPDGMALDKVREAATESGYLKEGSTTADLLDAIDKELRGQPVYSGTVRDQKAHDDRLALDELKEHLDRVGLDYNQLSNEQVRRELYQTRGHELWQEVKPVAVLTGEELGDFGDDTDALRVAAVQWYRDNLQGKTPAHSKDIGDISFTGKGRKEVAHFSADPDKLKLLPALREIIEQGEYIKEEQPNHPRKDGIVKFHLIEADVKMGGKLFRVLVEVGEDKSGNKFYDLFPDAEEHAKKKTSKQRSESTSPGEPGGISEGIATLNINTTLVDENVNTLYQSAPTKLPPLAKLGEFETGKPVTFNFIHNTESATKIFGKPKKDAPYDRGLEPSGRYISQVETLDGLHPLPGYVSGQVTFQNPLVVPLENWKKNLSAAFGNKRGKNLSKAILAAGYDGVVTVDGKHTSEILDLTTFDEAKALYQSGESTKRGFFRMSPDGLQREIGILKDANLSTFIHELGHSWLEELKQDAARDDAPDWLRKDWETVKAWLKHDGGDLTTERHEQFARGAEAYVMEGKAPSVELQPAFQRLKSWLMNIYRALTGLNVTLNDDVRAVFDRLLASEEEITAARQAQGLVELFATKEDAGMTGAEFEAYRKTMAKAHEAETSQLQAKLMQELQREQTAHWKEARAALRQEVEAEAQAAPVYRAIRLLTTGKLFDGSEGPALKLSRADLVRMYGEPFLKNLPRGFGRIYTKEGGEHPDVVADMFGYESGDAMIREMIEAPPLRGYVEAETDLRMRELHGDMFLDGSVADEAMAIIHGDLRENVVRAELAAINRLRKAAKPVLDAERAKSDHAKREMDDSIPPRESFKMAAAQIVGAKKVGSINPALYLAAERKAAKEAFSAVHKKDYEAAGEAKRKQLLNHYLYREAMKAKGDVEAMFTAFAKLKKPDAKLAKGRDVDMVNAARAILGRYGIGPRGEEAFAYLEQVRQNDPDKFNDLQMAVSVLTQQPKPWQELTMDELNAVHDGVMNLWNLSRRVKQVAIDGRTLALKEVAADLSDRLHEIGLPERRAGIKQALTKWDGMKTSLLGMAACMTRVEAWVDALDGAKPDGVFRKYLWNPVSDGVNAYRVAKKEYITTYLELVKGIEKTITHDKIEAPLLGEGGYTFSGKHELLGALLHCGNESNLEKLLVGRGWGFIAEDGGLDSSAWDATIKQFQDRGILTKADYDFIQGVWDLFEEIKPQAQQAHHQMYGYYFSEITAHPVNTPFGTYRGGYAPAIADPELTSKQGDRETADTITSLNNAAMFPTTGRGFTKERVKYNKPLVLDLRLVPSHIDKTMRFIHIEPRVKDVARIVLNPLFRDDLEQLNPVAVSDLLIPWLQRTARQSTEIPSRTRGGRALDGIFRALRSRTGLQLMIGNVSNTLQQFTGLALSATKVKPGHLAGAVWRYCHEPLVMAEEIAELSPFMASRVMQSAYDTQREAEDILVNPTTAEKAHAAIVRHGYILQQITQHTVDVITWGGAYDQAIAEGVNNKEAVRRADSAVRMTQGSFNAEDMSLSETGSPFVKAFTQFYNYFNMQGNLLASQVVGAVREDGIKGALPRMLQCYAAFAVTAIVSELIAMGFRGGADPDDEPLDTALQLLVFSQLRTAAAFIPFGGSMANSAMAFANTKRFDDRISSAPFASMAEALLRTFVQYPAKLIRGEEIDERRAVRDILNSIGLLTGVPVGPLGRPLGYLAGWLHEERYEPSGPLDAARGLITGTPSRN